MTPLKELKEFNKNKTSAQETFRESIRERYTLAVINQNPTYGTFIGLPIGQFGGCVLAPGNYFTSRPPI